MDLQCNADRFLGFADVYDSARPSVPRKCVELLTRYLGRVPDRVVDLGSGTGLSTRAWQGACGEAVGVEPSPDMIAQARRRGGQGLRFVEGYAHNTGLPEECADIVVCSQSFHWMDQELVAERVRGMLAPDGAWTVEGEGVFYGSGAYASFQQLAAYIKNFQAKVLQHPKFGSFRAFLTKLEAVEEPNDGCLRYRFVFVESPAAV